MGEEVEDSTNVNRATDDRSHTQREYEDLRRRLRDGESRPLSETDIAHARLRAAIRERLEAPYAGRDYQDELRRQENDLVALMRRTGHPVNLRSRNKRYTFWLHEKGDRLLVKVGWLGGRQSGRKRLIQPIVEDLAAKLRGRGACRLCGGHFERNGTKKKFCTPEHAARFRKLTWRERCKRRVRHAKEKQVRAENAHLLEQVETTRRSGERARRSEARRRQRAREKKSATLERIVNERETAFKEAGGKD